MQMCIALHLSYMSTSPKINLFAKALCLWGSQGYNFYFTIYLIVEILGSYIYKRNITERYYQ